jgi:hypothetical protein
MPAGPKAAVDPSPSLSTLLPVGRAVAGNVFGRTPFRTVRIVVTHIPRFASCDQLPAPPASHVAGDDYRFPMCA